MPARPVLVTTSWDDGHQLDEKLARELDDAGRRLSRYLLLQFLL